MHADERAGALSVDVEIADEELFVRAADLLLVVGEDRAGESVWAVVRDPQRVVKVLRLDHREDGTEDLLLGDRRVRSNGSDDRRLDEVAIVRVDFPAGENLSFFRTSLDVLLDLLHRRFI